MTPVALASKVEIPASVDLTDIQVIARAVGQLSPDPCDETTRLALVHLALRRGAPSKGVDEDCLDAALLQSRQVRAPDYKALHADDARLTALALLAFAGDLPDPCGDADLVHHHNANEGQADATPLSLVGDYLFLRSRDRN